MDLCIDDVCVDHAVFGDDKMDLCIDDVCVDHAVFGDDKMDLCIDDVCVDHAVFGDDKRAAYKLQPPLLYCPTSAMLVSE